MSTELTYLAYTALFTAIAWVPNILDSFLTLGIMETLGYPSDKDRLSAWAERAKKAHANASANLAVFAVGILLCHLAGITNDVTQMAASFFFISRVGHFVSYIAKVPVLRTVFFLVGFGCQVMLLCQVL